MYLPELINSHSSEPSGAHAQLDFFFTKHIAYAVPSMQRPGIGAADYPKASGGAYLGSQPAGSLPRNFAASTPLDDPSTGDFPAYVLLISGPVALCMSLHFRKFAEACC